MTVDLGPAFVRYLRRPLTIERELALLFGDDDPLTIFDVGACEGEDSIRYRRRFPNARVVAFEPLPANVATARRHFAACGLASTVLEEVALSDTVGHARFHVSSGRPQGVPDDDWDYGNKSSSLLAPGQTLEVHSWLAFDEQITVQTTTLEAYCGEREIETIDFMHLDVQGAELMVLRGAGPLLSRIRSVWMEVERLPLYDGQPLRDEVEAFMREHGFARVVDTVDDTSGDQLYIGRRSFSRRRSGELRLRKGLWSARAALHRTRR